MLEREWPLAVAAVAKVKSGDTNPVTDHFKARDTKAALDALCNRYKKGAADSNASTVLTHLDLVLHFVAPPLNAVLQSNPLTATAACCEAVVQHHPSHWIQALRLVINALGTLLGVGIVVDAEAGDGAAAPLSRDTAKSLLTKAADRSLAGSIAAFNAATPLHGGALEDALRGVLDEGGPWLPHLKHFASWCVRTPENAEAAATSPKLWERLRTAVCQAVEQAPKHAATGDGRHPLHDILDELYPLVQHKDTRLQHCGRGAQLYAVGFTLQQPDGVPNAKDAKSEGASESKDKDVAASTAPHTATAKATTADNKAAKLFKTCMDKLCRAALRCLGFTQDEIKQEHGRGSEEALQVLTGAVLSCVTARQL